MQKESAFIMDSGIFNGWKEPQQQYLKYSEKGNKIWRIAKATYEAITKKKSDLTCLNSILLLLQIGIITIDDILDEDVKGLHTSVGAGLASNQAVAMISAAIALVDKCEVSADQKYKLNILLNETIFKTAYGQYLDLKNPQNEEEYWRIVKAKSSPFYSCVFQAAAVLAGANPKTVDAIKRVGDQYGEMIQIHDDVNDCLETPANSDWRLDRRPLPILYAKLVNHPEREQFEDLLKNINNPQNLEKAKKILISSGGIAYCFQQLKSRYQNLLLEAESIKLVNIQSLVDEINMLMVAPNAITSKLSGRPLVEL